jgi:transcriptional regulator with XRE-family HTH domain
MNSINLGIGQRLKEERERLELTQTMFAAIGGLSKQAQINYEQGKRAPDAVYLSMLAKNSKIDVKYVLTEDRSNYASSLTESEESLLNVYRGANSVEKNAIDSLIALLRDRLAPQSKEFCNEDHIDPIIVCSDVKDFI